MDASPHPNQLMVPTHGAVTTQPSPAPRTATQTSRARSRLSPTTRRRWKALPSAGAATFGLKPRTAAGTRRCSRCQCCKAAASPLPKAPNCTAQPWPAVAVAVAAIGAGAGAAIGVGAGAFAGVSFATGTGFGAGFSFTGTKRTICGGPRWMRAVGPLGAANSGV